MRPAAAAAAGSGGGWQQQRRQRGLQWRRAKGQWRGATVGLHVLNHVWAHRTWVVAWAWAWLWAGDVDDRGSWWGGECWCHSCTHQSPHLPALTLCRLRVGYSDHV